nr:reverse transcriptase domain-containing protein [Tanacetum cinerariifolium]
MSKRVSKLCNDSLLKKAKTTQAVELNSLKRRVKKLKKKKRSRTHKLKRLYKVGLSARVESSDDNEDLGENASKQERKINDIDADEDVTLVNDQDDEQMFDVNDLQSDNVAATMTVDEVTLAQALMEIKNYQLAERLQAEKQQELNDEEKTTLFIQLLEKRRKFFAAKRAKEKMNKPPTQAQQRKIMRTYLKNIEGKKLKDLKNKSFDLIQKMFDRAFKRVNTFVDYKIELVEGSCSGLLLRQNPLIEKNRYMLRVESSNDNEDLGENASKQGRKINDIDADEDVTLVNDQDDEQMFDVNNLQSDSVAATMTVDEVTLAQALMEIKNYQLAERLQAEKQQELNDEEKTTLFIQLLEKRRKFFATKRAKEKTNKPPTQAQQRKSMRTYLKNIEGKKLKDLKNKSFDLIQKMFDRAFKRVNTFVDYKTELVEGSCTPSSNPTPSKNLNSKSRNRRRSKQRIEEFNLDELSPPIVMMADQHTMTQLLQAPTEGYEDAIVVPAVTVDNFELKHGLLTLVQNKQFFRHDKEDPHAHIRYFNKITSTLKFPNISNTSVKLMLFPFSLEGAARI